MKVITAASLAPRVAPAANFTGPIFMDGIITDQPRSRLRGLSVRFTPGVCTAWPAHPVGQTPYVTVAEHGASTSEPA
jgi:hypothetical protein